jgi:hypothetical protein
VDPGEEYRVVVTEDDGVNLPVTAEATVSVANEAPALDRVYLSPSYPSDHDDLTAIVTVSDPEGRTLSLAYRWYRDGVEASDVGDASTVDASATTGGEAWYVEVTASDGLAATTGISNIVTIAYPDTRRLVHTFTGVASPDGSGGWSTLVGTWEMLLQTSGALRGTSDCDAVWAISGLATTPCAQCEWAFETEIAYDASASTMLTAGVCLYLEEDGAGSIELSRELDFYALGPRKAYYAYSPYVVDRPITWYTYPNYQNAQKGYRRVLSLSTSEDTAGNLQIYGYAYSYFSL